MATEPNPTDAHTRDKHRTDSTESAANRANEPLTNTRQDAPTDTTHRATPTHKRRDQLVLSGVHRVAGRARRGSRPATAVPDTVGRTYRSEYGKPLQWVSFRFTDSISSVQWDETAIDIASAAQPTDATNASTTTPAGHRRHGRVKASGNSRPAQRNRNSHTSAGPSRKGSTGRTDRRQPDGHGQDTRASQHGVAHQTAVITVRRSPDGNRHRSTGPRTPLRLEGRTTRRDIPSNRPRHRDCQQNGHPAGHRRAGASAGRHR
jgi:hypothetical protein